MKKVERLKFIQDNFGDRFVLPYEECLTEDELIAAIERFEAEGVT